MTNRAALILAAIALSATVWLTAYTCWAVLSVMRT